MVTKPRDWSIHLGTHTLSLPLWHASMDAHTRTHTHTHTHTHTCVILSRSSEGLCLWESSGLLRFTPVFLWLWTQGCERLRASPCVRRCSSGEDSAGQIRSCERYSVCGDAEKEKPKGSSLHVGRLKLELRCMQGNPAGAKAPRWTLPPLRQRRFSTAVQTREPCGRHEERQPSSSEQDSERHWRLLGGAALPAEGASLRLRSCSRPLIPPLAPVSRTLSQRLSRLEPTGRCGTHTSGQRPDSATQHLPSEPNACRFVVLNSRWRCMLQKQPYSARFQILKVRSHQTRMKRLNRAIRV